MTPVAENNDVLGFCGVKTTGRDSGGNGKRGKENAEYLAHAFAVFLWVQFPPITLLLLC